MKKYLLSVSYCGFDLNNPTDLANNCWNAGIFGTKAEVVKKVKELIDEYISESIKKRFDENDTEKIKEFVDSFETSVFSSVDYWPELQNMLLVGELYLDAEYYFESVKYFVTEIGE